MKKPLAIVAMLMSVVMTVGLLPTMVMASPEREIPVCSEHGQNEDNTVTFNEEESDDVHCVWDMVCYCDDAESGLPVGTTHSVSFKHEADKECPYCGATVTAEALAEAEQEDGAPAEETTEPDDDTAKQEESVEQNEEGFVDEDETTVDDTTGDDTDVTPVDPAESEETQSEEPAPAPHEHVFGDEWVTTSDTHRKACVAADCDAADYVSDERFCYGEHEYGDEGEAAYTCTVCGYVNDSMKTAAEEAAALQKAKDDAKAMIDEAVAGETDDAVMQVAENAKNCIDMMSDIDKVISVRDKGLDDIRQAQENNKGTEPTEPADPKEPEQPAVQPDVELTEAVKCPDSNHIMNITAFVKNNDMSAQMTGSMGEAVTMSRDEISSGMWLWMELHMLRPDQVDVKDAAAIKAVLDNGMTLATYMSIDVYKQVPDAAKVAVDKTNSPVTITLTVPAVMRGEGRNFFILTSHNGEKAQVIKPVSYNAKTGELVFEADRFSTYALAYTADNGKTDIGDAATHVDKNTDTKTVAKTDAVKTVHPDAPQTGDTAMTGLYAALAVASLIGAGVLLVMKKRRA